MSTQGGLKHVSTEPSHLDNKRERRRGAAGRAAALRRAPSDSDCSGETASLSADSGDRAVSKPQPPARSGKTRSSRRRGSEWEVLEGLKDGQRFEKKPEVFNGYLHKKRKWPLKGWHKRFFVVDGGILVYARSPTDVSRGRLHGSVDVGLSVISAKARRRRIDIDADEFIYHLRAKTPEVFRTWLNVLKAHRLYRQHLLTFGARESVPKIHAPLDELPPTDTSTQPSPSATTLSTLSSNEDQKYFEDFQETANYSHGNLTNTNFSNCNLCINLSKWNESPDKSGLLPLTFESLHNLQTFDIRINNSSSNKSIEKNIDNGKNIQNNYDDSTDLSKYSTEVERQMNFTDLDQNSLRSDETRLQSSLIFNYSLNSTNDFNEYIENSTKLCNSASRVYINEAFREKSPFFNNKVVPLSTFFFFTRKRKINTDATDCQLKKSRKSTNLVKYRNITKEPPLKGPISKCMLLRKTQLKLPSKPIEKEAMISNTQGVVCDLVQTENNEVQVMVENISHKSLQDSVTASEIDKITEKLMISLFEKHRNSKKYNSENEVKLYINQIVKQLFDSKFTNKDIHPVKALFKSLLEYWLKNTSIEQFKSATTKVKSIDRQSIKFFTKDKNLSCFYLNKATKATQFHGLSDNMTNICTRQGTSHKNEKKCQNKKTTRSKSLKNDTENSFEKEKRIQELERLLKSTVYVCETARSNENREKDIKITKKLIENLSNLPKMSEKSNENCDKSNSSSELPKIQETIHNLISDTAIPTDIAKDFLGAYLDVLLQDSSKTVNTSSTQSSDDSNNSKDMYVYPKCDVHTESIQKKISKSITTLKVNDKNNSCDKSVLDKLSKPDQKTVDPGQQYLKDILDKITTIFSRVKRDSKIVQNDDQNKVAPEKEGKATMVDALGTTIKEYPGKHLIHENRDENTVVIDLSKYDLEQIHMFNDPSAKGMMSITVKLKEKPTKLRTMRRKNLSLKFSNDCPGISKNNSDYWLPSFESNSDSKFNKVSLKPGIGPITNKDNFYLKPYLSSSDATSKAYCHIMHESEHSFDLSFKSCTLSKTDFLDSSSDREDIQPCYIMSSLKNTALAAKLRSKKKLKIRECNGLVIHPRNNASLTPSRCPDLPVFEKTPRMIDEKFILLLLENLTLLSKNIPSLHRDINSLFIKLKKRHDKVVRNASKDQGLGLLGKIYDSSNNDNSTQPDKIPDANNKNNDIPKLFADIETNTSKTDITKTNIEEKSISSTFVQKVEINIAIQTETKTAVESTSTHEKDLASSSKQDNIQKYFNCEVQTSANSLLNNDNYPNRGISFQNWYRNPSTKDCAISTMIKYVLNKSDSSQNNRFTRRLARPIKLENVVLPKKLISDKKQSSKFRQEIINKISFLSPSFKVSTHSQTDRTFFKKSKSRTSVKKDIKVYQIFLSGEYEPTRSSSISLSNTNRQSDDLKTIYRCNSDPSYCSDSGGPLENASRELGQAQLSVQQLQRLLDALELQQQVHHDTDVSLEGASPNVKKDRRKFGLRKKKSNSKCASIDLQLPQHIDPSNSHMALSALTAPPSPGGGASSMPNSAASLPIACAAARPQSLPGAESLGTAAGPASLTSLTPDHQLREDFTVLAKDLVASLKSIVATLVCERGRLRAARDAADTTTTAGAAVMAALKTNLTSALHQNSVVSAELRSRLSRIHDASDLAEVSSIGPNGADSQANRQFQQSLSYSSSCVSASEFFDAEEHDDDLKPRKIITADEAGVIELDGDSSSEAGSLSSEEGSASSDNSDGALMSADCAPPVPLRASENGSGGAGGAGGWSRRARLPCPRPTPGGPSLWNLLYKNIGKDLSQISMPVTINEPLNMLQRLCEELEYSELLDAAADSSSAGERLALVAAFAVSAYAAGAHRAASKPFNPLLAETYECVRDDRGFRFIAEQVSHHPPISACHAESGRWCFWQEARIKTKFWGKSMEFQPAGRVHVRLIPSGDHYSWNKVTTCVHNLFGGQRWVDQYGDMHITCHGSDISCKLNFVKASSWSGSRHEVRGAVSGAARLRLHGRWSEALYAGEPPAARCLWRTAAMPPDHELYYGFTRFAMELNELEPGTRHLLPHTDTRLRPDQRALEEGDVEAAEQYKHQLEQAQRERRREYPEHTPRWFRKSSEHGEEMWVFTGEYWTSRDAGFPGLSGPRLW